MGIALDSVLVDIDIVLGTRQMTIREFISLPRGGVIRLDPVPGDLVGIRANGHLIARGAVIVKGDQVSVEISERIRKS